MGAVNFSIDGKLIRFFKRFLPLVSFIETGTMKGDTVAAVKPYFTKTVSIELSDEYYKFAVERFRDDPDVILLKGDSAALIEGPAREADSKPAMFWLDAHWCCDDEGKTGGVGSQCPLLKELRAIGRIHPESVLLVDDARLFLCTPGRPHDYRQWPDFHDITAALSALSSVHRIMVVNDVIVFYPEVLFEPFRRFVHETGVDSLAIANSQRDIPRITNEYKTLADNHETLVRTHGKTLVEIEELRRVCEKERMHYEKTRKALAALDHTGQAPEWHRTLMEGGRERREIKARMREQTMSGWNLVIQRIESCRWVKQVLLRTASIFGRTPKDPR